MDQWILECLWVLNRLALSLIVILMSGLLVRVAARTIVSFFSKTRYMGVESDLADWVAGWRWVWGSCCVGYVCGGCALGWAVMLQETQWIHTYVASSSTLPWTLQWASLWSHHEGSLGLMLAFTLGVTYGGLVLSQTTGYFPKASSTDAPWNQPLRPEEPLRSEGLSVSEGGIGMRVEIPGQARTLHSVELAVLGLGLPSTLLAIYLMLTSDPMLRNEAIEAYSLSQGRGLTPALQDLALAIHPPFLFLGLTVTALLMPIGLRWYRLVTWMRALKTFMDRIAPEATSARRWAQATDPWGRSWGTEMARMNAMYRHHLTVLRIVGYCAWVGVSLGLGWGAWWAYAELGWGGYWFWDPVENVALLPWLWLTATLHALEGCARQARTGTTLFVPHPFWLRAALIGALGAYPWVILGTWGVRSGLLTSVHAFAQDMTRALALGGVECLLCCALVLFAFLIPYQARRAVEGYTAAFTLPHTGNPRSVEPRNGETRSVESRTMETQYGAPQNEEPIAVDPHAEDLRSVDSAVQHSLTLTEALSPEASSSLRVSDSPRAFVSVPCPPSAESTASTSPTKPLGGSLGPKGLSEPSGSLETLKPLGPVGSLGLGASGRETSDSVTHLMAGSVSVFYAFFLWVLWGVLLPLGGQLQGHEFVVGARYYQPALVCALLMLGCVFALRWGIPRAGLLGLTLILALAAALSPILGSPVMGGTLVNTLGTPTLSNTSGDILGGTLVNTWVNTWVNPLVNTWVNTWSTFTLSDLTLGKSMLGDPVHGGSYVLGHAVSILLFLGGCVLLIGMLSGSMSVWVRSLWLRRAHILGTNAPLAGNKGADSMRWRGTIPRMALSVPFWVHCAWVGMVVAGAWAVLTFTRVEGMWSPGDVRLCGPFLCVCLGVDAVDATAAYGVAEGTEMMRMTMMVLDAETGRCLGMLHPAKMFFPEGTGGVSHAFFERPLRTQPAFLGSLSGGYDLTATLHHPLSAPYGAWWVTVETRAGMSTFWGLACLAVTAAAAYAAQLYQQARRGTPEAAAPAQPSSTTTRD